MRSGHWSHDVGHFIVGAPTEDDRRRSEVDLVEEYRRSLDLPDGERPSAEAAWLRYRASAAHGLAVWLSTLRTDGRRSRAVSSTLALRYSAAVAEALTVDRHGRILVAGYSQAADDDVAVARYRGDGSLDPWFGAGGRVTTDVAGAMDFATAIAQQSRDRIVVAGYSEPGPPGQQFSLALLRYHAGSR